MKTTSRFAVAAAAGLFMSGFAHAGGAIGGDCCADLEERVAELEATTARKGNRKVSLTVYGQVNKAILVQDFNDVSVALVGAVGSVPVPPLQGANITNFDGEAQIIDNPLSQSRFGLMGKAHISSDVYAGYKIEFGIGATGDDPVLNLRHNELYIGSKTLGRLTIGQGSSATDGISEIDLSGTASTAGGSLNISGFNNLDGARTERIRYDSPTMAGFKLSASWEENEDYDIALRFGSTFGDFTVAAGVGFAEDNDETVSTLFFNDPAFPFGLGLGSFSRDSETVSGSVSVAHNPTGLNLTFAAGQRDETYTWPGLIIPPVPGFTADTETNFWYLKAGIKRRLFAAGSTAVSIDYHNEETAVIQLGNQSLLNFAGEREKIGVQFVQNIDSAAMELYASFWSTSSDLDIGGIGDPYEEDGFMAGAKIRF